MWVYRHFMLSVKKFDIIDIRDDMVWSQSSRLQTTSVTSRRETPSNAEYRAATASNPSDARATHTRPDRAAHFI